jgi:hypothetical protein
MSKAFAVALVLSLACGAKAGSDEEYETFILCLCPAPDSVDAPDAAPGATELDAGQGEE